MVFLYRVTLQLHTSETNRAESFTARKKKEQKTQLLRRNGRRQVVSCGPACDDQFLLNFSVGDLERFISYRGCHLCLRTTRVRCAGHGQLPRVC